MTRTTGQQDCMRYGTNGQSCEMYKAVSSESTDDGIDKFQLLVAFGSEIEDHSSPSLPITRTHPL